MKRTIAYAALIVATIAWQDFVLADAPRSVEEAVTWLQDKSKEMIPASRRTMHDGVAAFPPQVGGGYEAFWLRDYSYMLEGCVEAFTDKELLDACLVFLKAQRADGACVDCVKFDGTPIYMPGYGTMGENPVADGSQFTVNVAWHTYQKTRNRELLQEMLDPLTNAMKAVPRNAANALVHIKPGNGWDRCPYGFTDSVRKQGDELFCSLLYVEASRRLADLLDAGERSCEGRQWRSEADRVAASVRTVFWDPDVGLFRAATVQCKEHDIWGSAFAVYLDVASDTQRLAVAHYFKQHYAKIVHRGQVRHLPGKVYWELAAARDEYQNGAFWATPTGWFVDTLDRVDPSLADRTVLEMVNDLQRHNVAEWVLGEKIGVPNYTANVTLPIAGIRKMLARRNAAGAETLENSRPASQ